jgi:rRNA maturation endonuclease Nob1
VIKLGVKMKIKINDWHTCNSCETEFKVVSDSEDLIEYCPYCGSVVDDNVDEDEDMEYDEED